MAKAVPKTHDNYALYSTVLLGDENTEKGNALSAETAEILVIKSLRLVE